MPRELSTGLPKELVAQGFENWAREGMPPDPIKVLHRQPVSEDLRAVFVEGTYPHLGKPHPEGWSGAETIVFEQKQPDGTFGVVKKELADYYEVISSRPQQQQRRHLRIA